MAFLQKNSEHFLLYIKATPNSSKNKIVEKIVLDITLRQAQGDIWLV